MEGVALTVELKTGVCRRYCGTLAHADDAMNLVLADAFRVGEESGMPLSMVQICGPSIRYIVFDNDMHLLGTIQAGQDRIRTASQKYQRGKRK